MFSHSTNFPARPTLAPAGCLPVGSKTTFVAVGCMCVITLAALIQGYWRPIVWQRGANGRYWGASSAAGKLRVLYFRVLDDTPLLEHRLTESGWTVDDPALPAPSPSSQSQAPSAGTSGVRYSFITGRFMTSETRFRDHLGFDWIWADSPAWESRGLGYRSPPERLRSVAVPYWPLALLSTAGTALTGRRRLAIRRRRKRLLLGRCPQCGYDLRATPNQCPECGTLVQQRARGLA